MCNTVIVEVIGEAWKMRSGVGERRFFSGDGSISS